MSNLTVKNIPRDLHFRLKRSAAVHRRSLNNQVIALLEQVLPPEKSFDAGKFLREVRKLRRKTASRPLSAKAIRKAIAEGRE